ncbi:L-threonylcarbamoyladenylate synthase, partial [uncultured Duncaniella sp.]
MTLVQDINEAVAVLKRGGVILYPTDTVWGIGCDATNSRAVRRVFEIKRRADSKALITLVADIADIGRFTS